MTHYVQPQQPDRSQLFVVPLKKSVAMRLPAFGGKGGQSGALVEPADNRIILTESSNEKKAFKTFLADRHVKTLREQAAVISYLDILGEEHAHTIDAVVEKHDGESIGLLVKDEPSFGAPACELSQGAGDDVVVNGGLPPMLGLELAAGIEPIGHADAVHLWRTDKGFPSAFDPDADPAEIKWIDLGTDHRCAVVVPHGGTIITEMRAEPAGPVVVAGEPAALAG